MVQENWKNRKYIGVERQNHDQMYVGPKTNGPLNDTNFKKKLMGRKNCCDESGTSEDNFNKTVNKRQGFYSQNWTSSNLRNLEWEEKEWKGNFNIIGKGIRSRFNSKAEYR